MSLETKPRLRVLVVDDEQKLTDLLRLELDVEGYEVQVASDGASGLIQSQTNPTPGGMWPVPGMVIIPQEAKGYLEFSANFEHIRSPMFHRFWPKTSTPGPRS